MDNIEFEFEQRGLDVQIQSIEAQIAALQLEKERYNYEKIKLTNAYNAYLTVNQSDESYKKYETLDDITNSTEELKPRKLKKID